MKKVAIAVLLMFIAIDSTYAKIYPLFLTDTLKPKKATSGNYPFVFRDVAEQVGLMPAVSGVKGHGAAWGDYNGDGLIDLYIGVFNTPYVSGPNTAATYGKRSKLFKNVNGKFELDEQPGLDFFLRCTGVVFADLDNDGDLDLYVANLPNNAEHWNERNGASLWENDGKGNFKNVSARSNAAPNGFGSRCVSIFDYDGDGLLDLLVSEDPDIGFNGSYTHRSRIFRNLGDLKFDDVADKVGLPTELPGYGITAADVNNDGWPDFFVVGHMGNRLFLNDGHGKFIEAPRSREVFAWPVSGGGNLICGVQFSDVNRDGLLDAVISPHFKEQWLKPAPIRLFLNKGIINGVPEFEEITQKAGLKPMVLKAPGVEIQDFDNDGWPDIYGSSIKIKDGVPYPYIARHEGIKNGIPQFNDYSMAVNDYPNADDMTVTAPTELTHYVNRRALYMAAAPTGDYNNDGKLDIFMLSWVPTEPSYLLQNETNGNNWLQVTIEGSNGVNKMGVGSRINIYPAGKLGVASALLGSQEMSVGFGYAVGHAAICQFGLGKLKNVDIQVILPHQKGTLEMKNVKANQRITVK